MTREAVEATTAAASCGTSAQQRERLGLGVAQTLVSSGAIVSAGRCHQSSPSPSCQSFTPNYSWVLGELTDACVVRVLKPDPRMRTHKDGRVNRTSGAQMNRLKLHTLNDTFHSANNN